MTPSALVKAVSFLALLTAMTVGLVISACSESKASSQTVECELTNGPILWQVDGVCGVDKDNRQMMSVGSFKDPQGMRTGCVSLHRYCVWKQ